MVPFTYFLKVQIECGFCSVVHKQDIVVLVGTEHPVPSIPEGWYVLNGVTFCSRRCLMTHLLFSR